MSSVATLPKCLSLCQPWAWAVASGFKVIENRSQPVNIRGRILIHASSATREMDGARGEDNDALICDASPKIKDILFAPGVEDLLGYGSLDRRAKWKDGVWDAAAPFHLGAIVGMVDIVGYVDLREYSNERQIAAGVKWRLEGPTGWYVKKLDEHLIRPELWANPGGYGWLLDNAVKFATPVPMKGRLSFFEVDPTVAAKVAEQIKLATQ